MTIEHLEEITARIIETNSQKKELEVCHEETQKVVRSMAEKTRYYEDIELGKKIERLYIVNENVNFDSNNQCSQLKLITYY